jgi:eukaryotic-like serine/threonine-protein kinase
MASTRYVSLKKIADGGMAEIFFAHQAGAEGFARPVIVKRIQPGLSADPQFRNMLLNEAHIAMGLNHGNIVPVVDLGRSRGRYFLVMELVDGWDLATIFRRARKLDVPIPLGLALHVVAEVCRGLAYAHARTGPDGKRLGIIHRDVSPHNVLVGEQGDVKLTDFGIAKALGNRDRTATGIIKGKLGFMSPEQASGEALAPSSDIFAVGTILYVLATGRRPFEGGSDLDLLLKVQRAEFVPLHRVRPDLPPGVAAIVNRAMQRKPANRYQTGEAMMLDIEAVLRRDFGSPGQSELKRWLAQLAEQDGAPTTSKLPALPVDEPLGAIGAGETATLELEEADIEALAPPAGPPSLPSLPARPSRSRPGLRALLLLAILTGATFGALEVMSPGTRRAAAEQARTVLQRLDLESADPVAPADLRPPPDRPPPERPVVRTEPRDSRRPPERSDRVTIEVITRPAGAGVAGSRGHLGRTPLRYTTRLGNTEVLRFSKNGYAPSSRRITAGPRTRTLVVELRRSGRGARATR